MQLNASGPKDSHMDRKLRQRRRRCEPERNLNKVEVELVFKDRHALAPQLPSCGEPVDHIKPVIQTYVR